MANMKWPALMLLVVIIQMSFWMIYLKSIQSDLVVQEVTIVSTGRIVKDPFASGIKKYLEQNGIASTGRVVIELSDLDQKIKFILSVARYYGIPLAFPSQNIAAMPNGHFRRGPSTSDSRMSITHKNTIQPTYEVFRQAFSPSPQTNLGPEVTLSARVKRDLTTNSEMSSKQETTIPSISRVVRKTPISSAPTTLFQNVTTSTGQVVKEEPTTTPETAPMAEVSTLTGRATRAVQTPFPNTTISTGLPVKETSTPAAKIIILPESATVRLARRATTVTRRSNRPTTKIIKISRILRALSTPAPQVTVKQEITEMDQDATEHSTDSETSIEQEATTPLSDRTVREAITSTPKNVMEEVPTTRDGDITESSTSDLNLNTKQETTTPPRTVREVATPIQAPLNQEVTRPSGRVFREILTQIPMIDKEENIPPIHKKPFIKKKIYMEGFIREKLSALIEELKQVKLQAVNRISHVNDDPTFPPPTDPEGTDF